MKKYSIIFAALLAVTALSCTKEAANVNPADEEEGEVILMAGFGNDDTRTIRQSDGKVFWSAKDEIAVVRGTRNKKFTSTNTVPAAEAGFKGTSLPAGSGAYWAVHPYDASAKFADSYFQITLPSEQEAVADTFAEDLFISVAYFTDPEEKLTFSHVVSGIKFTLTQPGIKKITLTSIDGSPVTGLLGIQYSGGRPSFVAYGSAKTKIELAPASGTFEVGKDYYFVTLPMAHQSGFNFFFEKEDGSIAYRDVKKAVSFESGHFKVMKDLDKGVEFEKDFFSYSPSAVSIPKFGGEFEINVKTDQNFHLDIASDWIHEVASSGDPLKGATYKFKADWNRGEAREGYVLVCNDSNCFFVTVTQEAGSEDDWKTAEFVHHALGMRFTATWCGYCPIMSETFKMAKAKLGDQFQYACFYSSSSGGNYGFYDIDTLMDQYAIDGFPTGIVDGRVLIENYASEYASNMIVEAARETETKYPTATSLGLSSSLDGNTVTVNVDVYAHVADRYKLTVLLLENEIVGYQADYTNGAHNDFVHNKVVREEFTPISGTACVVDLNAPKIYTFTVTVPDECDLDNLEVLAYIQRPFGQQTVIQSGDYGNSYVDNCYAAPVGVTTLPDLK